MRASDIMTKNVISVTADTKIPEITNLLLKHRISAVPVVNTTDHVIGMVSEGDLMRRPEIETDDRHSWWLAELFSTRNKAADYIKSHGRKASDVMTPAVITVSRDTPLNEIAMLLEKHHIKRVPVIEDGRLVGLVSRANLLHALAATGGNIAESTQPNDAAIRDRIMQEVDDIAGTDARLINVIVSKGVVQLFGIVEESATNRAVQLAAENTDGVKKIENNLGQIPPWIRAS